MSRAIIRATFRQGTLKRSETFDGVTLADARMSLVEFLANDSPSASIERIIENANSLTRKNATAHFSWWDITVENVGG